MQVFMVGLSHKTADVEVRERVAFGHPQLPAALRALCAKNSIRGAVILSTCNRMEIYVNTDDAETARIQIAEFIAESKNISRAIFEPHLYSFEALDAVHHLFSVVSSLDSMVLGEQQIIGQTRIAFKSALEAGCVTMVLSRLFRQALETGKRVRSQTAISSSHVSVSTVAIDVAKQMFPDLACTTVLVVGSGEMSELAARYLLEQGVQSLLVSSRTYAHACSLAKELGGSARYFEELEQLIGEADIIVSSTAAPHCIITPDLLRTVRKKVLILDIALPRDVDPACRAHENVVLYDLDDLGAIVEDNQQHRRDAARDAQKIVDEETGLFGQWVEEHAVTPTIKEMRLRAEAVREQEVERLVECMDAGLSKHDRAALEAATNAIVNKLLHEPTVRMRASAADDTDFECVEAARFLFGLSEGRVEHSHVLANETLSVAR